MHTSSKRNLTFSFLVYQIVHVFDGYHKQKIKTIRVEFVEDDFENFFIINCSHLKFFDISKIQWNEMMLREIQIYNEVKKNEIINELDQKF